MTRLRVVAALAASSLFALPALAQMPTDASSVARAFLAAAQGDDRPAVIRLLDEQVSVRFPDPASGEGEAEGRAFAIGYLDGLFHGQRAVTLDGAAADADGAVRIQAHDIRSRERYVIDLRIRGAQVVGLAVSHQAEGRQLAGLSTGSVLPR